MSNDPVTIIVPTARRNVATPAGFKKWRPGHYLKMQGDHSDANLQNYLDGVISRLDRNLTDTPEIQGIFYQISWGHFEPTLGTFDHSTIEPIIAEVEKWNGTHGHNYYIMMALEWKNFRPASNSVVIPQDLVDAGHLEPYRTAAGVIRGYNGAVWRQAVMDRFIAAMQELSNVYDTNDAFEIFTTTETVMSWQGQEPADYTRAAYKTQLIRLIQAMGTSQMFANTNASLAYNHGFTDTQDIIDLVEECYQNGVGLHQPDSATDMPVNQVFRGLLGAPRDYRGTIPKSSVSSSPNLGGKDVIGTSPTDVINAHLTIGSTHAPHTQLEGTLEPEQEPYRWDPTFLAAIQAQPTLATACPSQYPGCDVKLWQ